MNPHTKKDRHTGKGRMKTAPDKVVQVSASTSRQQSEEIERLKAAVQKRDEKIRQDAELIVRVRAAEQEAEELRESLRVEKELRLKAEGRKAAKDAKLSKKVRVLEAALHEAQKEAAIKPTTVSAEVVRDLQQSRETLRRGSGKLRGQLQRVTEERDEARQERDRAVASDRQASDMLAVLRKAAEEKEDGEKMEAATVPSEGGTDGGS